MKTKIKKNKYYCKISEAFIFEKSLILSEGTIRRYQSVLNNFYLWFSRSQNIDKKEVIKSISRNLIIKYSASRSNIQINSKIGELISLRSYFIWLYQNGHIDEHPYFLIQRHDIPKKIKKLPQPLDSNIDEKLQVYLEAEKEILHCCGISVLRNTGLRISELLNLPKNCLQKINNNYALKVPAGKTKEERLVPLTNKTVKLIKYVNEISDKKDDYLFSLEQKNQSSKYSFFRRKFIEIYKEIGAPSGTHLHQLRHSYATELINAGMNVVFVAKCLGHLDIKMTLRYCKITYNDVFKQYYKAQNNIISKKEIIIPEELSSIDTNYLKATIKLLEKEVSTTNEKIKSQIIRKNIRRAKKIKQDVEDFEIDSLR